MSKVRVYLSGGFHTNWQNQVMKACGDEEFLFLNPLQKETNKKTKTWKNLPLTETEKEKRSQNMRQSPWWQQDRRAIEKADIIFCYLEDYRPELLGTGAIFELGIAYSLGKMVILINNIKHRYYREFERIFISFKTLEKGIEHLKKCSWLK